MMHIKVHYSYDGRVPPEAGLYFCMYITPMGTCQLGLARVEFDMIEEELRWCDELPRSFGGAPPYCYFTIGGELTPDFMQQLERAGEILFNFTKPLGDKT